MTHTMYHVKVNNGPLQVMTATDPIDAIRSICRVLTLHQRLTAGEHTAAVRLATATNWSTGTVTTDAAGRVSLGHGWGLLTPAEPIPDSGDLPVEVFDVA